MKALQTEHATAVRALEKVKVGQPCGVSPVPTHNLTCHRRTARCSSQAQLSACRFDPRREAELSDAQRQLSKEVSALQDERERLWASLSAKLEFEYDRGSVARAVRGFDDSKVKGVVARLVTVRDTAASTALEAAAGGKLFNVIVDTADTGAPPAPRSPHCFRHCVHGGYRCRCGPAEARQAAQAGDHHPA